MSEATTIEDWITGTCDAGGCDEETVAVVITEDDGWLSMCGRHARRELDRLELAEIRSRHQNP